MALSVTRACILPHLWLYNGVGGGWSQVKLRRNRQSNISAPQNQALMSYAYFFSILNSHKRLQLLIPGFHCSKGKK